MSRTRRRRFVQRVVVPLAAVGVLVAACTGGGSGGSNSASPTAHDHTSLPAQTSTPPASSLPPSVTKTVDLYSHTRAGMFNTKVGDENDPANVYVPNLSDGTVTVISQATMKVIDTYKVGIGGADDEPQHVVPSWDLKTLWVNNNHGNSLTPIDPRTGKIAGPDIPVPDPYNLYFTPNGRSAIVMEEANEVVSFRDPHSFRVQHEINLGPMCNGVNHADFAPDGSYMIVTCEFAGRIAKINLKTFTLEGYLDLGHNGAPQDIKIDPYGKTWYVADMNANGVWEVDGDTMTILGFLKTGPEAHGLYPSRDGKDLYVSNRGGQLVQNVPPYAHSGDAGSVSVIDFATRKVVHTWPIAGGGTPDMGNVSADGKVLWLSGRRSNVVYAISTANGKLLAEIPVGNQPHGLAVWPLPGRYSLGHTGILR